MCVGLFCLGVGVCCWFGFVVGVGWVFRRVGGDLGVCLFVEVLLKGKN